MSSTSPCELKRPSHYCCSCRLWWWEVYWISIFMWGHLLLNWYKKVFGVKRHISQSKFLWKVQLFSQCIFKKQNNFKWFALLWKGMSCTNAIWNLLSKVFHLSDINQALVLGHVEHGCKLSYFFPSIASLLWVPADIWVYFFQSFSSHRQKFFWNDQKIKSIRS